MRDVVVSILFEVGEYLPVIVSVALLVVFQTVKKVLREWLGVDVSNDGGTLGTDESHSGRYLLNPADGGQGGAGAP